MKRSAMFAGLLMAMLTAGSTMATATEFDPNQMNRYPAYSEPFRGGNPVTSSDVRLDRRHAAPQHRFTTPQFDTGMTGQSYQDRASSVSSGGF